MPYNNHINNRYGFTRFENQSTTFVFNTCEHWFLFSIVCPQSLKVVIRAILSFIEIM